VAGVKRGGARALRGGVTRENLGGVVSYGGGEKAGCAEGGGGAFLSRVGRLGGGSQRWFVCIQKVYRFSQHKEKKKETKVLRNVGSNPGRKHKEKRTTQTHAPLKLEKGVVGKRPYAGEGT